MAREVRAPTGYVLASDQLVPPLVGDVQMLQYVDLEREGLTAYANIIKESISSTNTTTTSTTGHATNSTTNITTGQGTHQQNQHHHHHHHGEENVQHHTSKNNTLGHLVKWSSGSGGEHAHVNTGSSNIANIIHESNQMNQTSPSIHGLGLLASWRVNEQAEQQTATGHTSGISSSHHTNTDLAKSSNYNRETASSTHGNQGFQSSWTTFTNDRPSNQTVGQTSTQHKDKSNGDQTLTYIASWKARENVPQQQQHSTIPNVARESTTQNVSRVEEARVESLPIKTNPTTGGHKIQTVREPSSSSSRSSRSSSHMHGTRYRVESVRDRTQQHGQSKCYCNCRERSNAVATSSGSSCSSGGCHHKPQVYEIECKSHDCHHTVHVKTSISFDRVYNF